MKIQENFDVDVVISGLGPTGLTLAHLLGQRGRTVVVLEREPQFYGNARAVYTDDECMRIFQNMGIAHELAKDMLENTTVQMVLPDQSVLFQITDTRRPYGWSRSNFFYQPFLETRMAELLGRYTSVRVLRGREVIGFEQDAFGVRVRHSGTEGLQYGKTHKTQSVTADKPAVNLADTQEIRARYFVACDGGRSTIRPLLGVEMAGKSFPNPWLVVDIKARDPRDGLHHLPYFNFICDPACPTVSCVQPQGHHRFEFMLMPGQSREHMEDPQTIRQLLSRHIDVDKVEILRSLVYTFNALIADRWRANRVFLCGDSAHMTPQFIGQGMNAGVRDAWNLAWKLDAVMKGTAGDGLLDTYQRERRPHVNDMIKTAVDMKSFVSEAHPVKAALRNFLTRCALRTPYLGTFIRNGDFIPKPSYVRGSFFGMARRRRLGSEGRLPPQPSVRCIDGKHRLLDELLGENYALIGMGLDPRQTLNPEERTIWESLGATFVAAYQRGARPQGNVSRHDPDGTTEIEDVHGELMNWIRRHGGRAGQILILRPDRFVLALEAPLNMKKVTRSICAQLQVAPDALAEPASVCGPMATQH